MIITQERSSHEKIIYEIHKRIRVCNIRYLCRYDF